MTRRISERSAAFALEDPIVGTAPIRVRAGIRALARFWVGPADTRPLSLMRVTFGAVLVLAILDIAPVLRALLSDQGVLPRVVLLGGIARAARFSVFDAAGPLLATYLLYGATLLATIAFAVGFHTRAATIASFVLVSGLHERNLAVFDGADNVIRVLLFFLMFAPSGDHYSIDALGRGPDRPAPVRGAFAIRLVELQLCWVYLGSALGKLAGPTWRNGTALHYALQLEHSFTRRLGVALSGLHLVVTAGTYCTLGFEALFTVFVFSPIFRRYTRAVAVVVGTMLHAGIALTMRVGNFSYVMIACYPLFLDPEWAERGVRSVTRRLPDMSSLRRFARGPQEARSWPTYVLFPMRAAGAALFASVVWFSFPRALGVRFAPPPAALRSTVQALELWQAWDMFSPDPARADFYLRARGVLRDGRVVDVFHGVNGGPLPPEEPGFVFSRWTKFIANLAYAGQGQLKPFGNFLCRTWNGHDRPASRSPLATFKIYRWERPTAPLGARENRYAARLIWDHHCF